MEQSKRFAVRWMGVAAVLFFVFFIWAGDTITLQGERTIYTVTCVDGNWDGNQCSGRIAAGPRFRYRALKARGEVLFWTLGMQEPSSKLTGCQIEDGRNWTCPDSPDAQKSLTLALSRGVPLRNPAWSTRPFHSVAKLSWVLLDVGWRLPLSVD